MTVAAIDSLVDRAKDVASIADKYADEGDKNGQLAPPVVDALLRERILGM